nr:hypothetical protein Itr_chr01CG10810 [Ipomoea trifida]
MRLIASCSSRCVSATSSSSVALADSRIVGYVGSSSMPLALDSSSLSSACSSSRLAIRNGAVLIPDPSILQPCPQVFPPRLPPNPSLDSQSRPRFLAPQRSPSLKGKDHHHCA